MFSYEMLMTIDEINAMFIRYKFTFIGKKIKNIFEKKPHLLWYQILLYETLKTCRKFPFFTVISVMKQGWDYNKNC